MQICAGVTFSIVDSVDITTAVDTYYRSSPKWSPDGMNIAFTSDRDGNPEIYVMNADGSSPLCLANNDAADYYPNWSPDGTQLCFTSERDGKAEIYLMNANGAGQKRLTVTDVQTAYPHWGGRNYKQEGNGENES